MGWPGCVPECASTTIASGRSRGAQPRGSGCEPRWAASALCPHCSLPCSGGTPTHGTLLQTPTVGPAEAHGATAQRKLLATCRLPLLFETLTSAGFYITHGAPRRAARGVGGGGAKHSKKPAAAGLVTYDTITTSGSAAQRSTAAQHSAAERSAAPATIRGARRGPCSTRRAPTRHCCWARTAARSGTPPSPSCGFTQKAAAATGQQVSQVHN